MQFSQKVSMSVFGEDASKQAPAFAADHDQMAFVPSIKPNYKFRSSVRMPVMNWLYAPGGDTLAIVGPQGAGKSSILKEIAGRLNWPMRSVTGHSRMEITDLVGSLSLVCDPATGDQKTEFRYGPLALAAKFGCIFCLDEADAVDPSVILGLNAVLEGEPLVIADNGGEVIKLHPNFRFVETSNTRGQGDDIGLYSGTQCQNGASWDRKRVIEVGYMDEEDEVQLLVNTFVGGPVDVLRGMVQVANAVRKQFVGNPQPNGETGNLTVTCSTRTLLRWARIGISYTKNKVGKAPLAMALSEALTNRCDPAQRAAIHVIAKDIFGDKAWVNDEVLVKAGL